MAMSLITSEAVCVQKKSIEHLKEYTHLMLSFDGATTWRNQSIYTVHITTPDTRQAHFLNGHSASGISHTGVYLEEMLSKVIEEVGLHVISAISSDNAANAHLTKE
ncbi:hypothetical protein FRC11_000981 [Ceratobasidium sp. 423]|nr:hypothetical protein FRC11_000981 [Ceratobasidium sp. 423]